MGKITIGVKINTFGKMRHPILHEGAREEEEETSLLPCLQLFSIVIALIICSLQFSQHIIHKIVSEKSRKV